MKVILFVWICLFKSMKRDPGGTFGKAYQPRRGTRPVRPSSRSIGCRSETTDRHADAGPTAWTARGTPDDTVMSSVLASGGNDPPCCARNTKTTVVVTVVRRVPVTVRRTGVVWFVVPRPAPKNTVLSPSARKTSYRRTVSASMPSCWHDPRGRSTPAIAESDFWHRSAHDETIGDTT